MAIAAKATAAVIAGLAVFAAACNTIGPTAISNGRITYNQVIQETSKQQVFMNIVRVSEHEPTLFMDVTEVDAAMLMQVSANGAKTGLGARAGATGGTLAGSVGAIGGAAEYQESPTVRYQPLQGQPLVEQIATPITVETIGKLYDSEWHIGVILSLAADRITQDFMDSAPIIDAINALDDYGVIGVAAIKTGKSDNNSSESKNGLNINVQSSGQGGGGDKAGDTLAIYMRNRDPLLWSSETQEREVGEISALWERVHDFYRDQTPGSVPPGERKPNEPDWVAIAAAPIKGAEQRRPPQRLAVPVQRTSAPAQTTPGTAQQTSAPDKQTAKNSGVTVPSARGGAHPAAPSVGQQAYALPEAPDLRTHSAIGIIKNAFLAPSAIEIVSRARYERIKDWSPNSRVPPPDPRESANPTKPPNSTGKDRCDNKNWYTLAPRLCASGDPRCPSSKVPDGYLLESEEDAPAPDAGGLVQQAGQQVDALIDRWDRQTDHPLRCLYTTAARNFDMSDYRQVLAENRLFNLRRYLLVINEPTCPDDAYVTYSEGGSCYYIDKGDDISQSNFLLISQFLTMQAVPPQSQPLTPTISVGGQSGG